MASNWVNSADFWGAASSRRGLLNSATMTFCDMIGVFVTGRFVAFGLARLKFDGRNFRFVLVLVTMMLPPQVTLIPMYVI